MKTGTIAFINGNILTMDEKTPQIQAVLVMDGRIVKTGKNEDIIQAARKQNISVTDLKGKTMIPGLHDCHVHVMGTGLFTLGVNLYDAGSVSGVIDFLKEEAERNTDGWICGVQLDESRLKEKRPPLLEELTEAFPDRGVYLLDRGLHYCVVNQKAYDDAGLMGHEAGLCKDDNNHPNGRMHEAANAKVHNYFNHTLTERQRETAIKNVEAEALRQGITTIHAMEGGEMFSDEDIQAFCSLEGKTDVDFLVYWDTTDIDKVRSYGFPRIGTDILSDGSIGSRTAAFDEPYADDPSTRGQIYIKKEQMLSLIEKALKYHMQFGFHAIGQRAIRQVLDCYEEAIKKYPQEDARFRIEHFGFCDEADIERAAAHHIVISTQPSFSYLRGGPGSVYQIRTGEERERKAYPLRELLEKGIILAGGSDSTVTPMNPILGIHAAVNHPYPEHRLSITQALRMFTLDGAYSAFEEKIKGSVEPGKYGDFTVLSKSPYEVDADKIREISVEMTVKNGRIVYQKE